jgi:hypothetical protein
VSVEDRFVRFGKRSFQRGAPVVDVGVKRRHDHEMSALHRSSDIASADGYVG